MLAQVLISRSSPARRVSLLALGLALAVSGAREAQALQNGPVVFCQTYPDSPFCRAGVPACTMCHAASPPARNVFGMAVEGALLPGRPRPLSAADFIANLPGALHAVDSADSDGDTYNNADEIAAGTRPADPNSHPDPGGCMSELTNPFYGVCTYDRAFVYRRIVLDFCGHSPTFEERQAFGALSEAEQDEELDATLDRCLASEHWIGPDGMLWRIAYQKIRPNAAFKSGENPGAIQGGDYNDDFNYFVYVSTGDRDVREMLTGQYYVTRSTGRPTRYTRVDTLPEHNVPMERRAGMLTQRWFLAYFVMFAPLARTAASQAYRAFLGLDIARLEGLYPVANEPVDYDQRGVTLQACSACHSTLDPLTYPFRDYEGLNSMPYGSFSPNRPATQFPGVPGIQNMPEAGAILGQRVANLREWATVASQSDPFAASIVRDYWRVLIGAPPDAANAEYVELWRGLRDPDVDDYRVRAMLHRFIRTEAYGVP